MKSVVNSDHPPVDPVALLTTDRLVLSSDLRVVTVRPERLVVKYPPGRRYLACTPAQWRLLQNFGSTGRSVPDLLLELIPEGHCPSLRELYELLLRAHQAGILQAEGRPGPAPQMSAHWPLKLGGPAVRWLCVLALAAGIIAPLLRPVQMPGGLTAIFIGWLLAVVALSAGQALAAGVVRRAGGHPYHPQFFWKTPLPHFRIDLADAIMGGRGAEIDSALAQLAPMFAAAAATALARPEWLLPVLCGQFLLLSPLWPSPLRDLLRALYHDPLLDAAGDLTLTPGRLPGLLRHAQAGLADGKFLLARTGATAAWLLLVFLAGCVLVQANALDLLKRFQAAGGFHFTAFALLGLLGVLVLGTVGAALWMAGRSVRAWLREQSDRRRSPRSAVVEPAAIAEKLGGTLLFRHLSPEDLAALAAAVKPEAHEAGAYVVREGEQGDKLYLIYSGHLQVSQKLTEVGRTDRFGELHPGDLFGERALLGDGRRTATVRCATPCVLLTLDKAGFENLILTRLSRADLEDKVQKIGFLARTELARNWSQAALAAFAGHAKFHEFAKGSQIVRAGMAFEFFCVVHEGEFAVMKDGRQKAHLRRGDCYGELSMLGHNTAKADLTALTAGRCLLVPSQDFLRFITRDFAVALQFERIGAEKLGRPIFKNKK
ncbi:MAG: cyclic nucleotide-binding domain-containing protein [Lacunisphaera sp.]|nr:cyclic nucleotide-binding domain-containing protein [Lacunisphaera sp.]